MIKQIVDQFLTNNDYETIAGKISNEKELIEFIKLFVEKYNKIPTESKRMINERFENLIETIVFKYSKKFKKFVSVEKESGLVFSRFNETFVNEIKKIQNSKLILSLTYSYIKKEILENDNSIAIAAVENGVTPILPNKPSKELLKKIVNNENINIVKLVFSFKDSWWDKEVVGMLLSRHPEGVAIIPTKFIDNDILKKSILDKNFSMEAMKTLEKKNIKFDPEIQFLIIVKLKTNEFDFVIDKKVYEQLFNKLIKTKSVSIEQMTRYLSDFDLDLAKIPKTYGSDKKFIQKMIETALFYISDILEYFGETKNLLSLVDNNVYYNFIKNLDFTRKVNEKDEKIIEELGVNQGYLTQLNTNDLLDICSKFPKLFPYVIKLLNANDIKQQYIFTFNAIFDVILKTFDESEIKKIVNDDVVLTFMVELDFDYLYPRLKKYIDHKNNFFGLIIISKIIKKDRLKPFTKIQNKLKNKRFGLSMMTYLLKFLHGENQFDDARIGNYLDNIKELHLNKEHKFKKILINIFNTESLRVYEQLIKIKVPPKYYNKILDNNDRVLKLFFMAK
jgi:hypothetical protein